MKEKTRNQLTQLLRNLQFRVDTTDYLLDKPKYDYQPLPWVGITRASIRGEATKKRWQAIKQHINPQSHSLKDIGCCVGYFCISASEELDIYSLGVDFNDHFLRIANYAIPTKLAGKCNFIKLMINESSLTILPKTDVTLCLAIWHHWVSDYGLERATVILKTLWQLTEHTMFFESGEEETAKQFKLDFFKNEPAKQWLRNYLAKELPSATVSDIGEFEAGNYAHYKQKNIKRTLFKISRNV